MASCCVCQGRARGHCGCMNVCGKVGPVGYVCACERGYLEGNRGVSIFRGKKLWISMYLLSV